MRKRYGHHNAGGPNGPPPSATRADLDLLAEQLHTAEKARIAAVDTLARIRARGDAEHELGMPVDQHLRHACRSGRRTVDELTILAEVLPDLLTVRAALAIPAITTAQAGAICRHARHHGLTVRRALDAHLADDLDWVTWPPERLDREIRRTLATLLPEVAVERERTIRDREWLHVRATPDGQGITFEGRYEGVNAALLAARIADASDAPTAGERRAVQAAEGLARILAGSSLDDSSFEAAKPTATIHLLIDEATATRGAAAELWTSIPGLAPTLTADAVARLEVGNTIVSLARDGNPVAILGRPGHVIDDPDRLSWDSLRELTRVRDGNRCRMPGCDRPMHDVHHLLHREQGGRDSCTNLTGLCVRCHHRVLHRHGWTGHVDPDGRLHLRRGRQRLTTGARKHHRLKKPPTLADPRTAANELPPRRDRFGDLVPF